MGGLHLLVHPGCHAGPSTRSFARALPTARTVPLASARVGQIADPPARLPTRTCQFAPACSAAACTQGTADFSQLELKGNISSSYNLTVSGARL